MTNKIFSKKILVLGIIFIVVFFILVLILLLTRNQYFADGSVPNQQIIEQINYTNYWNYLIGPGGERVTEQELDRKELSRELQYLKRCGGLAPRIYILRSEHSMVINSREKLLSFLSSINTPEEAVAYLYAVQCGLSNTFGDRKQFVNKTTDGYTVGIIVYNQFGCGWHRHKQVVYSVTNKGTIQELATKDLEIGMNACVD